MSDNNKKSFILNFVDKNYEQIQSVELVSFSILVVGLLCFLLKIPNSIVVLVLGSVTTAISLFLQSYKVVEFEKLESFNVFGSIGFINFVYKLYFLALTVSSFSIISFVFQKRNPMALVGFVSLVIVLLFSLFAKVQDKTKVYDFKFYIRIAIGLFILVILAITQGIVIGVHR